jgi:hypothetical protein
MHRYTAGGADDLILDWRVEDLGLLRDTTNLAIEDH